ncbi:MAG: NAD(P)H-hydrate dehydratase [Mycobacteriales bacterium]
MRDVYTVEQCRAADTSAQRFVGEAVLIDRASTAVARRAALILGRVYGARVVVLAGSGHNGADALWAGVKLQQRGARVDVVIAAEPRDEHGALPLAILRMAGARGVGPAELQGCDLVIDGLTGLGFTGSLRMPELARAASAARFVVSVDMPSGVDADTGAVSGAAVRADVTVTFGGLKPGLLVGPGAEYAGQVEVADIGLFAHLGTSNVRVLDAADVAAAIPTPPPESSKYTRGVVGVIAGSDAYTGAAVLCCSGAIATGAGMVRFMSDDAAAAAVRAAWPEVVVSAGADAQNVGAAGKVDAWVVGPGMGTDARARELLLAVLDTDVPVVIDADGLTVAAQHAKALRRRAPTVLTPHVGEFVRLMGDSADDVRADRLGWAGRAADQLGVVVLLKGTTTVVASPGGGAYINPTGTPWLATAGTGDVLSGAIGTLLATGCDASHAAAAGAWLHGLAGRLAADADRASGPIAAGDVARHLPLAIRVARRRPGDED